MSLLPKFEQFCEKCMNYSCWKGPKWKCNPKPGKRITSKSKCDCACKKAKRTICKENVLNEEERFDMFSNRKKYAPSEQELKYNMRDQEFKDGPSMEAMDLRYDALSKSEIPEEYAMAMVYYLYHIQKNMPWEEFITTPEELIKKTSEYNNLKGVDPQLIQDMIVDYAVLIEGAAEGLEDLSQIERGIKIISMLHRFSLSKYPPRVTDTLQILIIILEKIKDSL